jgi:hypothetical protein
MMKLSSMLSFVRQYIRKTPIRETSAIEVKRLMNQEAPFTLLDANLWGQWVRGHLPGAKYVGMDGFEPGVLPDDRNALLVFYCESSL